MLPTSRDLNSILLMAPGRPSDRSGRRVLVRRLGQLREPVPAERRQPQREHPRPGVRHRDRGRDSGNDGRQRRRLCRVRPVQRRRRQHHHQVGRQPVLGQLPQLAQQRHVADADAVRNRSGWRRRPNRASTSVVPTYEYTLGGPIMRDRLWFFTSGRVRDESQGRTLFSTAVPYEYREEQRRYEVKGTYSMTPTHRLQVNYNHHDRAQVNHSFNQNATMDLRSLGTRTLPERLYAGTYSGDADVELLRRGAGLEAHVPVHRLGRQVHRPHRGHAPHRQQPRRRRAGGPIRSAASARPRGATARRSSSRARTSCPRRASDRTTSCSATTRSTTSAPRTTTSPAATTAS